MTDTPLREELRKDLKGSIWGNKEVLEEYFEYVADVVEALVTRREREAVERFAKKVKELAHSLGDREKPPRHFYIDQSLNEPHESWESGWEAGCLNVSTDVMDGVDELLAALQGQGEEDV